MEVYKTWAILKLTVKIIVNKTVGYLRDRDRLVLRWVPEMVLNVQSNTAIKIVKAL